MYTRPDARRRDGRQDVFIPENYSGTAFNDPPEGVFDEGGEKDMSIAEESEATNTEVSEPAGAKPKRKSGLFDGISTEDLLLLGVILLLSQEDEGNDILPILLILLFFRKQ